MNMESEVSTAVRTRIVTTGMHGVITQKTAMPSSGV
jgi:hypothetical protein